MSHHAAVPAYPDPNFATTTLPSAADAAAAAARKRAQSMVGRLSTILTPPSGDLTKTAVTGKTLLGS